MRKFVVHQYKDLDLTIHEAIDKIDINDIIAELKDFYNNRMTTYLIWDLNKGGDPDLSRNDMQCIIDFSKKYGSLRKNGKSAIVTDNNLYYGLSRVFEIYAEMETGLSLHFRVFRKIKEAKDWMEEEIR